MVHTERSHHKEYSCEISKLYAFTVQKLLAEFQRGGQNYRMTDRTKTICPPIFDLRGKKINSYSK